MADTNNDINSFKSIYIIRLPCACSQVALETDMALTVKLFSVFAILYLQTNLITSLTGTRLQ